MNSDPDHTLLAGSASQTDQTHSPQTVISTSEQTSMFLMSAPSSTSSYCSSSTSPFDLKLPESPKTSSSQHQVHRSCHQGVILPDMFKSSFLEERENNSIQNQLEKMGDQGQNVFLCFCLKVQYHRKFTGNGQVLLNLMAPEKKMHHLTSSGKQQQKQFAKNFPTLHHMTGR